MELRCSHKEHGFRPLLERIDLANRVTILTYSLEENPNSFLWESLRKLPKTSHLTIVTNIPGRWESYRQNQASTFKSRFDKYLDCLTADNFPCACDVYFSFTNHAKVLIVDDFAYVGSSNFTEASANNFEAGAIISGKSEIQQLHDFIKQIRATSTPMLKASADENARPLLNLLRWGSDIIRSVREENGFILSGDQKWTEDEDRSLRENVQISEKLSEFLIECGVAAEALLKSCGSAQEVLNAEILSGIIEFVRFFDERRYNDSLPKPFNEALASSHLTELLLNECSPDGNVNDVMIHPEYQERLEGARATAEKKLDLAVGEAVDDLAEHIENTIGTLRSAFGQAEISPEIDNTGINLC